ncbi:hypothetical protein OG401_21145 [Kitasatospora purpeofusca]|uniref:hypothetical protein n=1 Tax=Kitasatospora purpeofusca TaxID=67352 RepID=UPI0022544AA3|nr:hypothetical protein [Kitasatospora purpeofusca]MCX4686788.1 hypothetical protein [Kitasatospora purpeofusca]
MKWLLALCMIVALSWLAAWVEDTVHQRRQDRAEQVWRAAKATRYASASGRRPARTPSRP